MLETFFPITALAGGLLYFWKRSKELEQTLEKERMKRLLQEQEIASILQESFPSNELIESQRQLGLEQELKLIVKRIVSHDLSSPFTVMLCYLDLLSKKKLPESEVSNILEKSRQNLLYGIQLLQGLKELFNKQSELEKIVLSPYSFADFFSRECFEEQLMKKNLNLEVNSDTLGKILLNRDGFMHEVLTPLFDNAIKFSHLQGRIELKAWEESKQFKLSLRDYGLGLKSPQQVRAGTLGEIGLGLSLMKARFHLHKLGGSLSIRVQDPGTEVLIAIPLVTLENNVSMRHDLS